jgi:CheY-like chemotaxis protein
VGSLRVLIVDDDERFAHSLEALLESDGRFEIVGWASNGVEAISLVNARGPDVVTMDVQMPVMDGVAATRAICESFPDTPVVVLTGSSSGEGADEALEAGAIAHVWKGKTGEELIPALLAAVGAPVSPR